MNVMARISVGVTREQMAVLRGICHEGCKYETSFDAWLATSDARYEHVLRALRGWGFRQWNYSHAKEYQRDYELRLVRNYDAPDWEQAEYLEPYIEAVDRIYHVGRDAEGHLIVAGKDLVMRQDFEITIFNEWIARQRTRDLLEHTGLMGLVFKPVVVDPKQGGHIGSKAFRHPAGNKPPERGNWWEITSNIRLPAVSPAMTLTDGKGNPVPAGDETIIYTEREGSYNHAELHYHRSDMDRMEPFDIALTRERFHVNPRIVVSNDVPALLLPQASHTGAGRGSFHNILAGYIPVRTQSGALTTQEILAHLEQAYTDFGRPDVWSIAKEWLRQHGVSTS